MANQTVSVNRNGSMVIYTITNRVSGKVYVGQCRGRVKVRWHTHCSTKSGKGRSAIKSAILKYGKDQFDFAVVDSAKTLKRLNALEVFWIQKLNSLAPNGYNLTTGGESPTPTDEAKKKMSKAALARWDRQGRPGKKPYVRRFGRRVWTEEQKEVLRNRMLGFKHSRSARKKISESKQRPILRSDGVLFDSLKSAAKSVNRSDTTLCVLLKGKKKVQTCGGFGWRYAERGDLLLIKQ